ncbi:MAG: ImmA/IrrE family metallo-endopeptidase [Neisseriaceae bacterium]|nr:ImmA/IrrE family metallo-endopeptidase [Neisseriaceae bacterium]
MSSINYHISTTMLDWIADKQSTDRKGLAEKVGVATKKVEDFLQGIINKGQADKLTKMAGIPFGFLYLKEPPADDFFTKPKLPDFRTAQDSDPLTDDFYDTLKHIQHLQEWYKDYLQEQETLPERLPFIGKFNIHHNPVEIAQDIAKTIGFDNEQRKKLNKGTYFKYISELLEKVGILVFKNGVVGVNNSRPLNVREFRGFAIADTQVPVIFVNNKDAESAQLFTLLHETAHLWLGKTGISNTEPVNIDDSVEKLCNQVAAEFLVPLDEFLNLWDNKKELQENLNLLITAFKVSQYVIAIRALQNRLITQEQFQNIRQIAYSHTKKGSGGNPYATIPIRNSRTVTNAIVRSAMSKDIPFRDAAQLLQMKNPDIIIQLYKGK